MPLATTNHGITVPTVGASTDTWGTEGNLCWTTLDSRTPSLTGLKIDGTTSLPFSGAQAFAVGSAAAPGIWFTGDSNSGLYWIGADSVGISLGGTLRTTFATTGITSTGGFSGTTGTFSSTLSATTGTFTGLVLTPATATGGAGLRLPHGTAPSSPTNGDLWTTTAGLYARINGTTVGPYGASTGNWATPRNLSLTSDVTATLTSVDGSANVSAAATIANDAVTNAKAANMAQATIKGRASGAGTGDPTDLTGAQAAAIVNASIDLSSATIGTTDTTGDGYLKIGAFYYQWGTSTSTTSDGTVTVTLPYTSGTSAPIEGTIQACSRNLTSSATCNVHHQFVSATTADITFYANTHSSGSAPQGFNWCCWTPA